MSTDSRWLRPSTSLSAPIPAADPDSTVSRGPLGVHFGNGVGMPGLHARFVACGSGEGHDGGDRTDTLDRTTPIRPRATTSIWTATSSFPKEPESAGVIVPASLRVMDAGGGICLRAFPCGTLNPMEQHEAVPSTSKSTGNRDERWLDTYTKPCRARRNRPEIATKGWLDTYRPRGQFGRQHVHYRSRNFIQGWSRSSSRSSMVEAP